MNRANDGNSILGDLFEILHDFQCAGGIESACGFVTKEDFRHGNEFNTDGRSPALTARDSAEDRTANLRFSAFLQSQAFNRVLDTLSSGRLFRYLQLRRAA